MKLGNLNPTKAYIETPKKGKEKSSSILNQVPIEEVIGDLIDLEDSGEGYKACCPFHGEDTPSFHVNPSMGIYKCFGCGEGGNAASFVSEYEGIPYFEALTKIAKRYNLEHLLKRKTDPVVEKTHTDIHEFFQDNLFSGKYPEAIRFLKERGVKKSTAQYFELGYAPDNFDYFKNISFKGEDLVDQGYLVKNKKENYYPFFRGRIMIPLYLKGKVVGFSGRDIFDKPKAPKYLNSKDSETFKKKEILYGWEQNKKEIRKSDTAIIVEGYFDVIALHQYGHPWGLAFAGSYLSSDLVDFVSRVVKNVYLFADGDKSGKKSAITIGTEFFTRGIEPLIVCQEEEDPDSALKKLTLGELVSDYSYQVLEFIYRNTEGSKTEKIKACLNKLIYLDDPLSVENYLNKLSVQTGFEKSSLVDYLAQLKKQIIKNPGKVPIQRPPSEIRDLILISLIWGYPLNFPSDFSQFFHNPFSFKAKSLKQFLEVYPQQSDRVWYLKERIKVPEKTFKRLLILIQNQYRKNKIKHLKKQWNLSQNPIILQQIQELLEKNQKTPYNG